MTTRDCAVVIDWDQTIINSMGNVIESREKVPARLGLWVPPREIILEKLSLPREAAIVEFWPNLEGGIAEFDRVEAELDLPRMPLAFPGAINALIELRKRYAFLGLLTSRRRESLEETLEGAFKGTEFDIGMLDHIQALHDYIYHKPNPRVFDRVLAKIRRRGIAGTVYYIGDAMTDFEATIGIQVVFIAVLTGPVSKEKFLAAGVDEKYIVDTFVEIPELLQRLEAI